MKKLTGLLICILLLQHYSATAQSFAINTDGSAANASALLDVKSTIKGLLIPRMTKTERNSIVTPATGLMIFQTGPDSIGFHYYNGSSWSWVTSSTNGGDWKLTGNSGTNPATNFIGTSDNQPLRFRLNNTWAGELNGFTFCVSLGLNTLPNSSGSGNTAIGAQSMRNNSTGFMNTAIGSTTLYYNTTGSENTAVGYYALSANTIGRGNTATGLNALQKSIFGFENCAYGYFSLYENYSGRNNTAVGNHTLQTNKYGSNNTAIGDSADVRDSSYSNATAIGAQSAVNCSNCLVLGSISGTNGATSNVNVGIGTTSPDALLHVQRGAVLFDSTIGSTPVSGPGTRMMWIPAKGALRAGTLTTNYWDNDSIGINSFAVGYNTKSKGSYSLSSGYFSTASGFASVSMGYQNHADGSGSIAMGFNNTASDNAIALGAGCNASGDISFAEGWNSIASGVYSIAMGLNARASGTTSISIGNGCFATGTTSVSIGANNTSSGNTSTATGYFNAASGNYSFAAGSGNNTNNFSGFVTGYYNDNTNTGNATSPVSTNRLFEIGNGTAMNARSNAMTVLQNGNIGIGEVNPTVPLNFESTLGDKISLWGNGSNQYGFGIQPSLLQIHTEAISSDIAFGYGSSGAFTEKVRIKGNGNVGIGTNAPAVLLDVNGTTTTNALQVSNGTVITKMQSGSVIVGASASGQLVYVISFPVAFATGTPRVFATARNQPTTNYGDAFSVSVRSVTANNVTLNIQRTDTNAAWAQNLVIDWFAVE